MKFREDITIIGPDDTSGGFDVRGTLQNTSRSEDTAEGEMSVSDWLLFLPPGTPITHRCRVLARGKEFEVTQEPGDIRNDLTVNTPHHIEVSLRITGNSEATEVFADEEGF